MFIPEPVISVAVEPKAQADVDKMSMAIGKLVEEDPTLRVKTDEDSGQTILSGMGEWDGSSHKGNHKGCVL